MRIYAKEEKGELKEVHCNACGRECLVENGILKEGCVRMQIPFGYFSQKDGRTEEFDLCEECYERLTKKFVLPVETKERTELI